MRVDPTQVVVPVWTKLGALFGGVYGLGVVAFGVWDGRARVAAAADQRRAEMVLLAQVVAAGVDARIHPSFEGESDRTRPAFAEVVRALRLAIDGSEAITWGGTCTRDADGHWSYVVDGARTAPYPVGYPVFDGIRERDQAWRGEPTFVEALVDSAGTWHTVFAPVRTAEGAVVALVELAGDADRERLVLRAELRRAAGQLAAVVLLGLVLSFAFGRLLSRHLDPLLRAAQAAATGHLDVRVAVTTRDEIGVLGVAFNRMLEGLAEREFIRDTFGRFVDPTVVARILADRGLRLGGEVREVTVIASDLRGFTALCDERGAEQIVTLLNRYLARMTAVVEQYDGNVSELLGDGMIVLFGAPVAHEDDAQRAVACAVAMQRALVDFNAEAGERLRMGIGIDTGPVIAGHIGAERRMKYGVVGQAINLAARLEAFTLGNQVLISESTVRAAGDVEVEPPLSLYVKGRREPLRGYPVRAVAGLRMPDQPAAPVMELDAAGTAWRVVGKRIHPAAIPVRVVRLDADSVLLRAEEPLSVRDELKLSIALEGMEVHDVYGKVAAAEDPTLVHLTSVPIELRLWIEAFLAEGAGPATAPERGGPAQGV